MKDRWYHLCRRGERDEFDADVCDAWRQVALDSRKVPRRYEVGVWTAVLVRMKSIYGTEWSVEGSGGDRMEEEEVVVVGEDDKHADEEHPRAIKKCESLTRTLNDLKPKSRDVVSCRFQNLSLCTLMKPRKLFGPPSRPPPSTTTTVELDCVPHPSQYCTNAMRHTSLTRIFSPLLFSFAIVKDRLGKGGQDGAAPGAQ